MPAAPPAQPVRPPDFGEPAPFFTARTDGVERYSIEVAAGRHILLMVFGSLSVDACKAAHEAVIARRGLFNDADAAFYGVSVDPQDKAQRGLCNAPFGLRYFWDFDQKVSRLFGLVNNGHLKPAVFLIDPTFRILAAEPIEATEGVLDLLAERLAAGRAWETFAPILTLPRIFEPEFCKTLLDYFHQGAPEESGFAADVAGRTLTVVNPHLKRRQDVTIARDDLEQAVEERLRRRLFPMIKRAFGWEATFIERFLITRYGAEDQGFFSAHRDDVTAGTAHRKFAVTVNLNAEDYDGGDLRFPEFGRQVHRPPTGGATVFCCSLLHEVTPVTRGVRFAFVPFLYDDAGARLRRTNLAMVGAAGPGSSIPRRDRRGPRRR